MGTQVGGGHISSLRGDTCRRLALEKPSADVGRARRDPGRREREFCPSIEFVVPSFCPSSVVVEQEKKRTIRGKKERKDGSIHSRGTCIRRRETRKRRTDDVSPSPLSCISIPTPRGKEIIAGHSVFPLFLRILADVTDALLRLSNSTVTAATAAFINARGCEKKTRHLTFPQISPADTKIKYGVVYGTTFYEDCLTKGEGVCQGLREKGKEGCARGAS